MGLLGTKQSLQQDAIAFWGEFVGTASFVLSPLPNPVSWTHAALAKVFLFLGLGGIKSCLASQSAGEAGTAVTLSNQEIIFISTSMGLSLLITAWMFYRITGGLFNPAVTLALWLVGAVPTFRSCILVVAQIAGGIAGSALVEAVTPGGVSSVITKLEPGMSKAQGLFLEALLTALLVFAVLMLAAEKHKATYLAPVGIGLTLFGCQLFGTLWTGCGMNPARSFGPSAVAHSFPSEHWIYWLGPFIGSLISVFIYIALKTFTYEQVVMGQDDDKPSEHAVNFQQLLRYHRRGHISAGQSVASTDPLSHAEKGTPGRNSFAHEQPPKMARHASTTVGNTTHVQDAGPQGESYLITTIPAGAQFEEPRMSEKLGVSGNVNQPVGVGHQDHGAMVPPMLADGPLSFLNSKTV